MKRREMIKDKNYFNFIIKKGRFSKDKYFVIYFVEKRGIYPQYGIAIKKNIGSAVVRNRIKRQVRSIIDNNKKLFKNENDYIIMIRNEVLGQKYQTLNTSIERLLKGKN